MSPAFVPDSEVFSHRRSAMVSKSPEFANLEELYLDPLNPRLGHHNTGPKVKQEEILELMEDWKLDELAISFLESDGFWTQEALMVAEEPLYGTRIRKVVIEGNRRLAALKFLNDAFNNRPVSRKWRDLVEGRTPPSNLFTEIPYLLVSSRDDVESYIGFRHVTGIEEWRPAEKAEYIAKMVDKGMDYRTVMRRIGSKTPTVRQNYIAHRLLLEIEKATEIPRENFEDRFSVMFLSMRSVGVQKYLNITISAEPGVVKREIPRIQRDALKNFATWLFGDDEKEPLFTDSRKVDTFGNILLNQQAVEYLERSDSPTFDVALRIAGGDEIEIVRLIQKASDNIQLALTRVHHFKKSDKMRTAVNNFSLDAQQLLELFPEILARVCAQK